jgi:hypothetical protein
MSQPTTLDVVIETDALELYQSDGPAEHCVGAYKHVD